MPKRKKYPKLPNGYGSIRYLGKGRRNPFAVHPPTTEFDLNGIPKRPAALCYVDSWMKGFAVLTAYHSGSYYPGIESTYPSDTAKESSGSLSEIILANYNQTRAVQEPEKKTFEQVFQEYYTDKFDSLHSKKYSKSTRDSIRSAFKNCSSVHDRIFEDLRHDDLQTILNNCGLRHAGQELIVTLLHQMYAYAETREICDKDYSRKIVPSVPEDDEHGIPFWDEDLRTLWKNKDDPYIEFILIMCYSGYRISAYKNMEVNLEEKFFKDGVKTSSSKNRIVPVHSAILPLVQRRIREYGCLLPEGIGVFRKNFTAALNKLGMNNHTPHDCRHTFSRLCESYKINENDRKRMLGHVMQDLTNKVYGHRTIDELRIEIEKIKLPSGIQ